MAGLDARGACGVVSGAHHIRQRQQRRHQRVVLGDGQADEGPLRLRHAHGFSLAAVEVAAPEAAVQARRLQALMAEDTRPVRPGKRHDDEIARLERADVVAHGFEGADELVPHAATVVGWLHLVVGPQVAAADAGAGDPKQGVRRLDQAGVWDVLDADVACAVHQGCAHTRIPPKKERKRSSGTLAVFTVGVPCLRSVNQQ